MKMRIRVMSAVVMSLALLSAMVLSSARAAGHLQTIAGLGTISFPTSTKSAAAQTAFIRGVLLLHVFEYPRAAAAFRQAEKLDPGFAMAYWGEAMTYDHPVWDEVNVLAGRAALNKLGATPQARAAKAPTAREKAYLAAVAILYFGAGSKRERDTRYCKAMQQLAVRYPYDNNAQLLYALALLGRNEGVRNIPDYLHAAAIAKRVFRLNPDNPGATHYWIHGMDDPQHAAGALVAARALAKIAPDAAHAQHMTSHIFMALGMWDDVVKANQNAMRVVNDEYRAAGRPEVECGHYQHFLEYAYFQQGRYAAGEGALDACARTIPAALAWANHHVQTLNGDMASTPSAYAQYLYSSLMSMRATAVIESQDWNGQAARLMVDTSSLAAAAAFNDFTNGYAAAERGDMGLAQQSLSAIGKFIAAASGYDPSDPQEHGYIEILQADLEGIIAARQGNMLRALALVRQAANRYDSMAFDFGPPVPIKPPHELLGELLLQMHQAKQAIPQFEVALKKAPQRTQSLLGLARAEAASDDVAEATATYKQLVAIWHAADPGLPGLIEAREYLHSKP